MMRKTLSLVAALAFSLALPALARKAADGKPVPTASDPAALYVWHDGAGWHLRVAAPLKQHHAFEGVVRTFTGAMGTARPTKPALASKIHVTGGAIYYELDVTGTSEGFDFDGPGDCMTFEARIDGKPVPEHMFVGVKREAPSAFPFDACK